MNNEVKSVFVIESGNYVEITYQEFLERRSSDSSYKSRKFILVEKHIMELSEENYRAELITRKSAVPNTSKSASEKSVYFPMTLFLTEVFAARN